MNKTTTIHNLQLLAQHPEGSFTISPKNILLESPPDCKPDEKAIIDLVKKTFLYAVNYEKKGNRLWVELENKEKSQVVCSPGHVWGLVQNRSIFQALKNNKAITNLPEEKKERFLVELEINSKVIKIDRNNLIENSEYFQAMLDNDNFKEESLETIKLNFSDLGWGGKTVKKALLFLGGEKSLNPKDPHQYLALTDLASYWFSDSLKQAAISGLANLISLRDAESLLAIKEYNEDIFNETLSQITATTETRRALQNLYALNELGKAHMATLINENNWPLKRVPGVSNSDQAIQYAIDNKLTNVNLHGFRHILKRPPNIDKSPFEELQGITSLTLSQTSFSDQGVGYLPEKLTYLDLSYTGITDQGLQNLPKQLTELNLSSTEITHQALDNLPEGLKKLDLSYTKITQQAIENKRGKFLSTEIIIRKAELRNIETRRHVYVAPRNHSILQPVINLFRIQIPIYPVTLANVRAVSAILVTSGLTYILQKKLRAYPPIHSVCIALKNHAIIQTAGNLLHKPIPWSALANGKVLSAMALASGLAYELQKKLRARHPYEPRENHSILQSVINLFRIQTPIYPATLANVRALSSILIASGLTYTLQKELRVYPLIHSAGNLLHKPIPWSALTNGKVLSAVVLASGLTYGLQKKLRTKHQYGPPRSYSIVQTKNFRHNRQPIHPATRARIKTTSTILLTGGLTYILQKKLRAHLPIHSAYMALKSHAITQTAGNLFYQPLR